MNTLDQNQSEILNNQSEDSDDSFYKVFSLRLDPQRDQELIELFSMQARANKKLYNFLLYCIRQHIFLHANKDPDKVWNEDQKNLFEQCSTITTVSKEGKVKNFSNYDSRSLEAYVKSFWDDPDSEFIQAQTLQQTIKKVLADVRSWRHAKASWKKNPSLFNGRPRLPKYKKKEMFYFSLTNQQASLADFCEEKEAKRLKKKKNRQKKKNSQRQNQITESLPAKESRQDVPESEIGKSEARKSNVQKSDFQTSEKAKAPGKKDRKNKKTFKEGTAETVEEAGEKTAAEAVKAEKFGNAGKAERSGKAPVPIRMLHLPDFFSLPLFWIPEDFSRLIRVDVVPEEGTFRLNLTMNRSRSPLKQKSRLNRQVWILVSMFLQL